MTAIPCRKRCGSIISSLFWKRERERRLVPLKWDFMKLILAIGQCSNCQIWFSLWHTFHAKCSLLEWTEIPLGHLLLMENTHKGMNYDYIHEDSLHAPLPFSSMPVSVASKLHMPRELLLPLLPSSWPHLLTKIVKLMAYNSILWEISMISWHMRGAGYQCLELVFCSHCLFGFRSQWLLTMEQWGDVINVIAIMPGGGGGGLKKIY